MLVMNFGGKAKPLVSGLTVVLLGMVLTGCSGEPTEADLKKALQAEMDETNQLAQTMLGQDEGTKAATTIHAVNKLRCEQTEEEEVVGYRCQVALDITYPPAKRQKRKASIRMGKEDNNWVIVKRF